jgi:2,3-bisphosphoglycerate-dependent phosphoglycerate mutase
MKILLVRHGEAVVQEDDSVLTDLGVKQAEKLAEYLKGLEIDRVVCSSLTRTKQTAEKYLNLNPDVDYEETDDAIEIYRKIIGGAEKPGTSDGREERDKERANKFFERLQKSREGCIVVFSHGNMIRYLLSKFAGKKADAFFSTDIFTASVSEIEDGEIVGINNVKFLGELAQGAEYLP